MDFCNWNAKSWPVDIEREILVGGIKLMDTLQYATLVISSALLGAAALARLADRKRASERAAQMARLDRFVYRHSYTTR